jgi:hypothetical protein
MQNTQKHVNFDLVPKFAVQTEKLSTMRPKKKILEKERKSSSINFSHPPTFLH